MRFSDYLFVTAVLILLGSVFYWGLGKVIIERTEKTATEIRSVRVR